MVKRRMKALENTTQHEQHVKKAVFQQIYQQQSRTKNKLPVSIIAIVTVAVLAFLTVNLMPKNDVVNSNDGHFVLGEIATPILKTRIPYFIAIPITWQGEAPVELITYDILNSESNPIRYEEDGFVLRAFDGDDNITPGVYEERMTVEDFSVMTLQPNEPNIVIFEVVISEHFNYLQDYQLKLVFGNNEVQLIEWTPFHNMTVKELNTERYLQQLTFTDEERKAYEAFKASQQRKTIKHLQPMSIMKLYYAALIDGNTALQYELYTKQEELVAWRFEDQLQFSPFDYMTPAQAVEEAQDFIGGHFIESNDGQGAIEANSMTGKKYFTLIKDPDMWAVSFMPTQ